MFKKSLLIMLLMALMAPWGAKGQSLADYTFSTGTDANKWITLSNGATTLLANAKDDEASSKTNIGFTFPFGSGTYTQFWVNSNGVFSFSSSTSTSGSSGQFTNTYVNTAQPKICGIAKDLTTGSDGYVKSELTGTAPNRVLVCEFFTTHEYVSGYSSVSATCKWQVQLYEANSKVVIVYGSAPASAPSEYQIGLGQSSTNFWTVNPSTHTATAQTSYVSTTYSVWPGANRYYAFESPTCFKPQNIHATLTPGDGTIATFTWERNAQGTEDAWVLEYGTAANFEGATSVNVTGGTPSKDLTGLTAEQKYYARVKPDCDTEGNLWSDAISFTPTDTYAITVYDDNGPSSYIPMHGNYFDDFTKSECIIPATELGAMQWGQITSLTFYAKTVGTNSSTWANTNQKVFVKEVNFTTFGGSFSGMDGATIVFDGLLPMPTTSTDGYTITFSQPYTYSGGNLLIGVYNDDDGSYNDVVWYGKTGLTAGVSAYGTSSSSLASVDYNELTFLPKTTFNYIQGSVPSCLPPTGLAATEDQPNESELSWTANNGETSWNIYYKKASAASYTEIADVIDNPYTLPNLDPATQYQYYVVANCTETSDPSAVFPFTTACEIISTYPWTENFDSYAGVTTGSTNNLPLCWNYLNNCTSSSYKGYPVVYNESSSSYSGNNHLHFYSYSSYPATEYAILPEMQSLDGKMITFYARYYNYKTDLVVGVMTDPTDATTFSAVETISDLTTSYKKYTINFDAVTAKYIAFKMVGNYSNTYYIYIDNLEVKLQPDCATPTGLAVTANSQTPEGATITWTAGDASSWIVEYKTSTDENYSAIAEPVNEATYTFTGLNYSTTYNVRVKVNCTEGSGVSYPTEPVNFTTNVQFPAPTNFETSNLTHNSVTLAWTAGYTNQTAWKVQYKKSSDSWTDAATIVNAPTIDITELVANTAYDVRIYGGIGENFGTDYLSGDFTTKNPNAAPTDFVVSNLTASSATISWTPGYTTQDHWTVEYKKSTEEWTAATTENVTSPTINLDNLDGLTTYNVRIYYVEAHKLFGDFTTAAGLPFTEEFSTTSIPTNWENKTGLLDNVMTGTALISGSQWSFGTYSNLFNSHARINIYGGIAESNARYGWLITPNITVGNNYSLSFDLALTNYNTPTGMTQPVTPQTTGTDDKFIVLVSTDNEANWTVLRQWDNAGSAYVYNDIAYNGETVYIDLAAYNNQTVRIAFYGESTVKNADNNLHIDNVEVNITNTCYKPTNVASSNVTNHSATITWVAGTVGQELWQLKYNKGEDFDPNTEGESVVVETNPTYTFNKTLDAASVYYVYVRGNCGTTSEPDYGPWSKKCTFNTGAAAPDLTTFNKTGVGPNWVDLYWNQSAGDLLSGYGIYYSTTSTAPTAETPATVTIDNPTAPTSENPYRLTGLTSETTYDIWVRANHEAEVYSSWKAITGYSFTTLVACPTPIALAAKNITHTTADLTWTGYSDSYTVQKRTAASTGATYLNEGFENNGEWPTGWDNSVTSNDSYKWLVGEGSGYTYVNGYSSGGVTTAANGSYNALYFTGSSGKTATAWLITPTMDLTGVTDAKLSFNYCNPAWSGGIYELKVNYRVDEGEWQLLKTYNTAQASWNLETITLSGMAANYQIGFSITGYDSDYGYGVGIDDVKVFSPVPAGEWADVATNVTETSYPLTDLTAGTKYDVRVKGNCGGEYSATQSFTTIDNNTKIFKTAGNWNVAGNWDGGIPTIANNAIIRANAIVPADYDATANSITFEGATMPTLTIKDGGQLHTKAEVTATFVKDINAATVGSDENWYLISSPIGNVYTSAVTNLLGSGDHKYNLYNFNETTSEWNGNGYGSGFTTLTQGIGYLYRNNDGADLTYTGTTKTGDVSGISLTKAGTGSLSGFNLIGNPYPHNITSKYLTFNNDATFTGCYTLKTDGAWVSGLETVIKPGEGFFVQVNKATTATFHETDQTVTKNNRDYIQFMVSNSEYEDVTFALFDKGNGLNKINHRNSLVPMLFIPQNGENYAIANMSDNTEAFNLNFKAATTGKYTLKYNAKGEFSYLHVIDRLTGADTDMLLEGEYSFIASNNDNDARFLVKLSYKPNYNIEGSNIFAYQNGSDIVVMGEGDLQIFDVMGRMVSTQRISGIETINVSANGVYIFRLVGETVKTQKIIVK